MDIFYRTRSLKVYVKYPILLLLFYFPYDMMIPCQNHKNKRRHTGVVPAGKNTGRLRFDLCSECGQKFLRIIV
jgi:hypothetical protein